jgi:putative transposase
MTANPNPIDLPALLEVQLQRAEPDLLRSMLSGFVQALMSAEATRRVAPSSGHAPRSG